MGRPIVPITLIVQIMIAKTVNDSYDLCRVHIYYNAVNLSGRKCSTNISNISKCHSLML